MDSTERAAIAATLPNDVLLARVRDVAGRDIGDPLNVNEDSIKLREQFGLTVEYSDANWTRCTVFAFNDCGVCAAVKARENFTRPHWARRATCIAVASMWAPASDVCTYPLCSYPCDRLPDCRDAEQAKQSHG
jgi:hypothetical protein